MKILRINEDERILRSNMHWHLALGGKKSGMPNEG